VAWTSPATRLPGFLDIGNIFPGRDTSWVFFFIKTLGESNSGCCRSPKASTTIHSLRHAERSDAATSRDSRDHLSAKARARCMDAERVAKGAPRREDRMSERRGFDSRSAIALEQLRQKLDNSVRVTLRGSRRAPISDHVVARNRLQLDAECRDYF
jgi:hypothetical protein